MRSLWYGLPTRNVHWIVGSKGSESLPTHTQLLATEGSVSASFTSGLLFWFITLGSSENQRLNAGGVWLRHPKSGLYSGGLMPVLPCEFQGWKLTLSISFQSIHCSLKTALRLCYFTRVPELWAACVYTGCWTWPWSFWIAHVGYSDIKTVKSTLTAW